jgi:nitroimidazol reductase NimA-like FMN-containing flavoprotein (pyridoxamine 5'-phosphate oxidase superfamily)
MSDFVDTDVRTRALAIMGVERSAVLALCHEGRPRCFQMAVALEADSQQVYLATSQDSSKYPMLLACPLVCLFFSTARNRDADPQQAATLEVHGVIETVAGARALQARQLLVARHRSLEQFFCDPGTRILAVRMTRLVLTEHFQQVSVLDVHS